MNVLQVRPFLERGGATRAVLALSAGLSERGHRVLIACKGGDELEKASRIACLRRVEALAPSSVKNLIVTAAALSRIVRQEKIDLLASHHRFAALACRLTSLSTGVPLVSTVHELKEDRWLLGAVGLGGQVITLSQATKDFLVQRYRVHPERIRCIPMGIDLPQPLSSEAARKLRRALGISDGQMVVGCVGRLSPEKGQTDLLEAALEILRTRPETVFLFVGEGAERDRLEAYTRGHGLEARVRFLGWRDDAARIIGAMDVLVVPSLTEGLGLAALEALAWKKPVVASGVGGLVEVIHPEHTGLLVPPRSPHEIAVAVMRLLNDRDFAAGLGENGYRLVREGYSIENMIDQTEQVYRKAIG